MVAGEEPVQYTVNTYDLWTLETTLSVMREASSTSPALDIAAHGYLVKTPIRPTVAISMRTLELLYRLQQRKASLSMEAFEKVLCDYYLVCIPHASCTSHIHTYSRYLFGAMYGR